MSSLPAALIQSLQNLKGFDEEAFKAVHQSGGQITSVRLNPGKLKIENSQQGPAEKLKIEGAVPWSSNGYYLQERPSFTLDPLFHAGAYYVQEASSMFLEEALKQTVDLTKPVKILDLCAAPGGKSTLIQSLISADSLLVSNEVIKTRVNILAENITKWGAANVIVTNNDPKDFQRLQNYFDVIVVDAPCSGSGLFRKDPNAINEWSENNVSLCAHRQQRIIADIILSLKDGGVLIYSTCSYSKAEDEEIADWLTGELKVESVQLKVEESWGIVETISDKSGSFGYRFYPDKVKGEGFFMAAFKKPESLVAITEGKSHPSATLRKKVKNKQVFTVNEIEAVKPFLVNADSYFFIKQHEAVIAMPLYLENDLTIIQSALYIKKAGVRLGTIIRNELIPAHDLAVSNIIDPSIPKLDVDTETALQYLRKVDITIESVIKGWVLITHQDLPIGWIKILANRANNYYPAAWRILNK
ncbi:MAG: RNA methyltransferase [Chitinophagaceae bacterium]|nr:RNA methyltransferase [Chitinophagaceae bacterium]